MLLADNVWTYARPFLPLQANVMLSYPIDEAEELLVSKETAAKQSLTNCEEDLEFLREQITVCGSSCHLHLIHISRLTFGDAQRSVSDHGGCHSKSVQLGGCAEAEREGRGREGQRVREGKDGTEKGKRRGGWLRRGDDGGAFYKVPETRQWEPCHRSSGKVTTQLVCELELHTRSKSRQGPTAFRIRRAPRRACLGI